MSLEDSIKELNGNIVELIATLKAGDPGAAAPAVAPAAPAEPKPAGRGRPAKPKAPTYEDAKAKALEVNQQKGRDTLVATLQRMGVAKVQDLGEENFAPFIELCDQVLKGLDPTAGATDEDEGGEEQEEDIL